MSNRRRLKLLSVESESPAMLAPPIEGWSELTLAFERATGRRLVPQPDRRAAAQREAESNRDADYDDRAASPDSPTAIRLTSLPIQGGNRFQRSEGAIDGLAQAIGALVDRAVRAEQSLRQRDAELATATPVRRRPDEMKQLAARLEGVLKAAAGAIGGREAVLYLLDEATTQLRPRAAWSAGRRRLPEARSLSNARADLEAMLGHVVVTTPELFDYWSVPTHCAQSALAMCAPVASSNHVMGVLWLAASEARTHSEEELALVEVAAGRLAVELEREQLLAECFDFGQWKRDLDAAEQLQRSSGRHAAPVIDGWQTAGRTMSGATLTAGFYDWFPAPDGAVSVVSGHAYSPGVRGAIAAAGLRSSLRAHGQYVRRAEELAGRANQMLWAGTSGDQLASLATAVLEPDSDNVQLALAGTVELIHWKPTGVARRTLADLPLGLEPESHYRQHAITVSPGETLLLVTSCATDTADRLSANLNWDEHLHGGWEAGRMVDAVLAALKNTGALRGHDRTVVALQRRASRALLPVSGANSRSQDGDR